MRYDTENEIPYINEANREDAYEEGKERAVEKLWFELAGKAVTGGITNYVDSWDVVDKLVCMIANHRATEEAGMRNLSLSYDIRKAQRASDRQQFVTELQAAVEELFESFIEKEIEND